MRQLKEMPSTKIVSLNTCDACGVTVEQDLSTRRPYSGVRTYAKFSDMSSEPGRQKIHEIEICTECILEAFKDKVRVEADD